MLSKLKKGVVSLAKKKVAKDTSELEKNTVSQRMKHYIKCMVSQDVEGLFNALLEDMDKEKILLEVKEQQDKHPDLNPQELSVLEITTTAKTMSGTSMLSGMAWVVPGISLLTGPMATAGEIIALFVFQSRLVVKIGAYYGLNLTHKERARDIAVCVASSSLGKGASVVSQVVVKEFGPKLAKIAAQKLGQTAVKGIPGIGALAGIVGGAVGSVSNYYALKGTGAYALKMYGGNNLLLSTEDDFDRSVIFVAVLVAQADGKITNEEKDLIHSLIDNSTLSDTSKEELSENIYKEIDFSIINQNFSESEKKTLLTIGIKMSLSDGELCDSELDQIFKLAKHFSIDKNHTQKIVEEFKNKQLLVKCSNSG